ncbi:uncharacterized protein [Spinacia oleracea]|uniref:Uncharacterized protein isoform X1 n=1 Tax=Spinacia oleracea TaxID=3562 RepID=A0A9R0JMC1_SPIOL|nr:uncharacterized protein LOC110804988 isoform X1 [Spinacia oleracea]
MFQPCLNPKTAPPILTLFSFSHASTDHKLEIEQIKSLKKIFFFFHTLLWDGKSVRRSLARIFCCLVSSYGLSNFKALNKKFLRFCWSNVRLSIRKHVVIEKCER